MKPNVNSNQDQENSKWLKKILIRKSTKKQIVLHLRKLQNLEWTKRNITSIIELQQIRYLTTCVSAALKITEVHKIKMKTDSKITV